MTMLTERSRIGQVIVCRTHGRQEIERKLPNANGREQYALSCGCVRAFEAKQRGFIEVACARCGAGKAITTPRSRATAMCNTCRTGGGPVAA